MITVAAMKLVIHRENLAQAVQGAGGPAVVAKKAAMFRQSVEAIMTQESCTLLTLAQLANAVGVDWRTLVREDWQKLVKVTE